MLRYIFKCIQKIHVHMHIHIRTDTDVLHSYFRNVAVKKNVS